MCWVVVIPEHVVNLDHVHIADVGRGKNFPRRLGTGYARGRGDLFPAAKGARYAHLSPKPYEQRNTYQEKPSHHIAGM
jgi:hypothetical protein